MRRICLCGYAIRHADSHRNSDGNRHGNGHRDDDGNRYANGYFYSDCAGQRNIHTHMDGDRFRDAYADFFIHTDIIGHAHIYTDFVRNPDPYPERHENIYAVCHADLQRDGHDHGNSHAAADCNGH